MLTISRFFAALFIIVIVGLYGSFFAYYLDDQQNKSELVIEDYHRLLNETGYLLKTDMESLDSINNYRSHLNRWVAQDNLVQAIVVVQANQIILTTDPSIKQIPAMIETHHNHHGSHNNQNDTHKVHELKIEFYEQNEPVELSILLFPNQFDLQKLFSDTAITYLLFSFIPTLLIGLLILWLLQKTIINPLEKLRQFAYYHEHVPNKMRIRELESIRSSMFQTFERLGEETRALYQSARTDELSGLPNRFQLNERLEWVIDKAKREKTEFAFLFVDIDDFKKVNDTLGHDAGDELLINLSSIMQSELRKYDILARIGGDEFVVIIENYHNHLELTHIIERVLEKIAQDHIVRQQPINVSASIGVSMYPKDGEDAQTLMKNADIAMYEAKKEGKNQLHFFTEELHQKVISQIEIEQQIRKALQNQEFELYYQPKVDTHTKEVIGVESLIRWHHPTKGFISPAEFIPVAEQSGLIIPLGDWIIEQAIKQQIDWATKHKLNLQVSVNVSAIQFSEESFIDKLEKLIHTYDFDTSKLDIEVTESLLMENSDNHLNIFNKLKTLGMSVSLDDFGTGYSSLAYLKAFPIDYLKIDKAFIDDYQSTSGAVFIETIIHMAHNLNIAVIAEGIEEEGQRAYLEKRGCEFYQGYLFSKPLPSKELIPFLLSEPKALQ